MRRTSIAAILLMGCGIWLIALGAYFLFLRPPFLPEDTRFIGASVDLMQVQSSQLARWLSLVFDVLGGFIASNGALTFFIGWRIVPGKLRGTLPAVAFSVFTGMGLMSVVNFVLSSDFRLVLAVPPVLGILACVLLSPL